MISGQLSGKTPPKDPKSIPGTRRSAKYSGGVGIPAIPIMKLMSGRICQTTIPGLSLFDCPVSTLKRLMLNLPIFTNLESEKI
jgi:hypothetical protein